MLLVCIYFAVGGACGLFKRMLKLQRPHGRFIRFIQWERCCLFAVPAHAVPDALALSGFDPEFGDRGLMPVFELAQDRLEILTDRQPAIPVIEFVAGVMWLVNSARVPGSPVGIV
jgi:hypothetical protein